MKLAKMLGAVLLVLMLLPTVAPAQDVQEMKVTIVGRAGDDLKVKTREGEETLKVSEKTKGLENATEGTKVTIKYTEKDGQKRAREIAPR